MKKYPQLSISVLLSFQRARHARVSHSGLVAEQLRWQRRRKRRRSRGLLLAKAERFLQRWEIKTFQSSKINLPLIFVSIHFDHMFRPRFRHVIAIMISFPPQQKSMECLISKSKVERGDSGFRVPMNQLTLRYSRSPWNTFHVEHLPLDGDTDCERFRVNERRKDHLKIFQPKSEWGNLVC